MRVKDIHKPKAYKETCVHMATSQILMEPHIIPEDTSPQNKTPATRNSIEDDHILISPVPTLTNPSNTNTTTSTK